MQGRLQLALPRLKAARDDCFMSRRRFTLRLPGGASWTLGERTLVMGIVNVTPDSFSDGGALLDVQAAVEAALRMVDDGADLLDIGGESTRPGRAPVAEAEELRRVVPVIEALAGRVTVPISIDTYKAAVADARARGRRVDRQRHQRAALRPASSPRSWRAAARRSS